METLLNNGVIAVFGIIIAAVATFIGYYIGRAAERSANRQKYAEKHDKYLRETLLRDEKVERLTNSVNRLNELNSRYLAFMIKVPTVAQRLNGTLNYREIVSSVIQLVHDIISTHHAELYILDRSDNLLKPASLNDNKDQEQISYAIGEGLIGMAAMERMIKPSEHIQKASPNEMNMARSNPQYSMAVPVVFKDMLLGVIGIGAIKNPAGNENVLMKMIADIAAVALLNRTMLSEAKQKANTDPLTGLHNRNYFQQMSLTFVEKAIREGTPISIFLFDIDNFKHYNDTNGHDAGDRLLIELSQLVDGITRKNTVLARYGGEEFIVILPGISRENALVYAERVRETISTHSFPYREKQPKGCISVSGGVASFPFDGDTLDKVIQLADRSLYKAKTNGKNRVILHESYHLFKREEDIHEKPLRSIAQPSP